MALAVTSPLSALNPDTPISGYWHRAWGPAEGMPRGEVTALAQTRDRYLWIGTDDGLIRFDGKRFESFNKRNTPAIRSNEVRALCAAPDGALWVGMQDGIVRFQGAERTRVETASGEAYVVTQSLLCQRDGSVLAGTSEGGLFYVETGKSVPLPGWGFGTTETISALALDEGGAVWVGTRRAGLLRCAARACEPMISPLLPSTAQIMALAVSTDGRVWIAALGSPLLVAEGLEINPGLASNELIGGQITNLASAADGALWVGTNDASLSRVVNGSIERFEPGPEHALTNARRLLISDDGSLWIGTTSAGLHLLTDAIARSYPISNDPGVTLTWAIMEDSTGQFWIGSNSGGAIRTNWNSVRTVYTLEDPLLGNSVNTVAETPDGRIWLGTLAGVYEMRPGSSPRPDTRRGAPSNYLMNLFVDSMGRMWVGGTDAGARFLDADGWHVLGEPEGFTGHYAWRYAEDSSGSIWITTPRRGLFRYRDGQFSSVTDNGKTIRAIAIYADNQNRIWIAVQDAGLQIIVDERVHAFGAQSGLPTDQLFSIIGDDLGALWIGTNRGMFRLELQQLESVLAGTLDQATPMLFNSDDGMRSDESNRDSGPLSWKSRDGNLWFATTDGVVRIDPRNISRDQSPPPPMIVSVVVDGERIDHEAQNHLATRTRRIDVGFAAVNFSSPDRVHYRYRLDGLDREWVNVRTRDHAELTGLKPGAYRFDVETSINGGPWSPQPASFAFSIAIPFHESPLFLSLVAGLILIFGVIFHHFRVTALSRRTALLQERNEMARELHDTLAQSVSGTLVRLELAARMVPENCEPLREHLLTSYGVAKEGLDEVRRVVHRLRSEESENPPLHKVLETRIARQLRSTGIKLNFRTSAGAIALGPVMTHQICRIMEEAVSNAILHARTRKIDVSLEIAAGRLELSVLDYGGDVDLAALSTRKHAGIRGMRERAEEIGAVLDLERRTGAGLCVTLRVPVPDVAAPRVPG